MAGTVVAVFNDKLQAERAANALINSGVPTNDVSLVRKDAGGEAGSPNQEGSDPEQHDEEFLTHAVREVPTHDVERPINTVDEIAPRTAVGVVIGAPMGLLIVTALMVLPGMGAVMANTPLLSILGASIIGGIIGGLVGAMTAGGIPEEAAKSYHNHILSGNTLVTVLAANHNHDDLETTLRSFGGRELGYFPRFIDSVQSIES